MLSLTLSSAIECWSNWSSFIWQDQVRRWVELLTISVWKFHKCSLKGSTNPVLMKLPNTSNGIEIVACKNHENKATLQTCRRCSSMSQRGHSNGIETCRRCSSTICHGKLNGVIILQNVRRGELLWYSYPIEEVVTLLFDLHKIRPMKNTRKWHSNYCTMLARMNRDTQLY